MAAAVDFCPADTGAAAQMACAAATAEFSCAACSEAFASAAEQRAHCKSERHVYNTKRRLAGLKPISLEAWERKLRESRAGGMAAKGTAHLKEGKEKKSKGGGYEASGKAPLAPAEAPAAPADGPADGSAGDGGVASEEPSEATPEPYTPERCLFDRRKFDSMDACLEYMGKAYSFFVPDREYCTDLPGFLAHLHSKFHEPPHACLYCNRRFLDAGAVKRHMLDMAHTRIGTEARSRRGGHDKEGSRELQEEMESFFDFHGSTREITARMTDPLQKVASLLRFFDEDRNGFLSFKELAALWSAANDGAELSEAIYHGACGKAGADPEEGLDKLALHRLYAEGLADLDLHFAMLQEALAQKLSSRARARREAAAKEAIEEAIEEGEEDEEPQDGEDEEEEDDDDEDGDSDDDTEVLECDDDEEFEEVMRVLGLQPATITETGDLQLPNGKVVGNRDVAHIWRQRGMRMSQLAIAPGRPKGGPAVRTPLMLTANGDGATRIAMSSRAQAKEGKRMVAILRRQQHWDQRMGIRQNLLMKKNSTKIRTTFGDASGGR